MPDLIAPPLFRDRFNALLFARIFGIASLVGTMLSLPLTHAFVTLSLVCWCISGFKSSQSWAETLNNPAVFGALLLFCWMLLSVLWAPLDYKSSLSGAWKYRKLMWVPLMVVLFADEKWRLRAIQAWLAAAVVLMLFSLEQTLPAPWGTGHMSVKPASPLSVYSYITLGFILLPAVTLGLAWLTQSKANILKWAGAFVVLLTIGYVVFGQEGRTTYVTLVALVAIFIITQFKGGRQWLAMGVLVLGAASVFLLNSKVQTRFNQVLIESQAAQHATTTEENFTSSGQRIAFWRGSVEVFRQHPIMGAGIGTWADEYRKYIDRTPGTPAISVTGGNPHQEYLLMAAQLGAMGLFLFLFWIGQCVLASRRLKGPDRLAAQTLLAAFVVGCWFNSYLFDSATGHFFCLGLGILFSGYRSEKASSGNMETVG